MIECGEGVGILPSRITYGMTLKIWESLNSYKV